jgi:S1-C subfamily serine protease
LVAICACQANVSAVADDEIVEPTDPTNVAHQFADHLAKLLDKGSPVDLVRVREQLPEEQGCSVNVLPPPGGATDPRDLYAGCRKSVVFVGKIHKCDKCRKWHTTIATGFVISPEGAIVTSYHVLAANTAGDAIAVRTWDGQVLPIQEVLAASKANDLAVIKVDANDLVPLPVAPSAPVGTEVFVISHPVKNFHMMTTGIVSGHYLRKERGKATARHEMTITADFAKGSSGAPVLDSSGAVVGIVRGTTQIYYEKKEGVDTKIQMVMKYCIPSASLLRLLGQSTKDEKASQ